MAPSVSHTSESLSHRGVCVQIPVTLVFRLFRIAHIGVIAQRCAAECEIKSLNSYSTPELESSHMSETSHPYAIEIQVRNYKIDRTPVR